MKNYRLTQPKKIGHTMFNIACVEVIAGTIGFMLMGWPGIIVGLFAVPAIAIAMFVLAAWVS